SRTASRTASLTSSSATIVSANRRQRRTSSTVRPRSRWSTPQRASAASRPLSPGTATKHSTSRVPPSVATVAVIAYVLSARKRGLLTAPSPCPPCVPLPPPPPLASGSPCVLVRALGHR